MYKKIMVAVDGSDTAKRALEEAENIANTYNATIRIVHAIGNNSEVDQKKGEEILAEAESSVDVIAIETQLLTAEIEYGLNGVAEAIAQAAVDWETDLRVVGTANRRGLERFFVGSVAEQLVAKVDASILLVRPQTT